MSKVTNLHDSPEFREKTLAMIEKSLGYEKENSFQVDFYPLFNESNYKNCHILIEEDKVIGHIGCLSKRFELLNSHPINMYGGIAIEEGSRGKGYFTNFFQEVLKLSPAACLSFLWSDQLDLYEKFDFYPCIELFHYHKSEDGPSNKWVKTSLKELSEDQVKQLSSLYQSNDEIRILRDKKDWETLSNITSTDLYIRTNQNQIENYFFIHKGQDLKDIIHEYGEINDETVKELTTMGHVWTPYRSKSHFSRQELFGSVVRLGDEDLFKKFVKELAGADLVNRNESEITVRLDDEEFTLLIKDFLPGLLGPGKFKEFETQDLFISGLDSI